VEAAFEAQRVGLAIPLGGEPIAECGDKINRTFFVTAADEPDARRRSTHRCRGAQRNHRAAEYRKQIASLDV
jgi:hypothetical protein